MAPSDLRKETAEAIRLMQAEGEVKEARDTYDDSFEGGQQAAFMDVLEAMNQRVGKDHINVLNELRAYVEHRLYGTFLDDSPSGWPEQRTTGGIRVDLEPPEGSAEAPAESEDSGEGGEGEGSPTLPLADPA